MECSWLNLGACVVEYLFDFILSIVNAPLKPFLFLIKEYLTQPVRIDMFIGIWGVIIYMLSLFYGIFILIAGFKFLVSGYSVEQRESAKQWLTNILLMIILVQASYFLYSLSIELISSLTAAVYNMIPVDFFSLTFGSFANVGIELALIIPYLAVIVTTMILLSIRYILVSAGVILFPIGIFFYFIPFLQPYGKLILNTLFTLISLPFFYSVIFLTCSKLLDIGAFADYQILVSMGAFCLVIFGTAVLLLFVLIKSALKIASVVSSVSKVVAIAG